MEPPFDQSPKSTSDHHLDREGTLAVRNWFTDPLFIVHDVSEHDYGVDIVVEALHDRQPLNFRSCLQLKARSKDPNGDGSISVSIPTSNLTHLLGQPLSGYLLYDAPTKRLFHKFAIDAAQEHRSRGNNWSTQSFTIRFKDVLDDGVVRHIHDTIVRYSVANRAWRFGAGGHNEVVSQMEALVGFISQRERPLVALLVREAARHFDRAMAYEQEASFLRAIQSLQDAISLLSDSAADQELLIRALAACGGLEAVVGRPLDSLATTSRALALIPAGPLNQIGAWAVGNHAMALYTSGQIGGALQAYARVLDFNRASGDLYETMLTRQHMAECYALAGDHSAAMDAGVLLAEARDEYLSSLPEGEVTEAALGVDGTLGNIYYQVGCSDPRGQPLLAQAVAIHRGVMSAAAANGLTRLQYTSQAQLALALWNLDRLSEAAQHLEVVAMNAPDDLAGCRARAAFNLGLVRSEEGRFDLAAKAFGAARADFVVLGDPDNVSDCDQRLQELMSAE